MQLHRRNESDLAALRFLTTRTLRPNHPQTPTGVRNTRPARNTKEQTYPKY